MRKFGREADSAERLFAELCAQLYLRGFVFHSPKFRDPTEQEAGDVVLWVRCDLIVFELLSRNPWASGGTKSFVKQIGRKRDQLTKDFRTYGDSSKIINMVNELREKIFYDHDCFISSNFCGVVIIDADSGIERLHFETVNKSLNQGFSITFMMKQDFTDLLVEIDTVPDLLYYLKDRTAFAKTLFPEEPKHFLDLNHRLERNLIGFYKLNHNSFPIERWRASPDKMFWTQYRNELGGQIQLRDRQNADSLIFDEIIELLRNKNKPNDSTLLHSWELASLSRRFRAGLSKKLNMAFQGMLTQRSRRHFAFHNPSTECWSLFYFRYGGDSKSFIEEAERLTRMKVQVERVQCNFHYSVFCFAFRKSRIVTGNTFDECVLRIEDAERYPHVNTDDYQTALAYFRGNTGQEKIYEFPA